MATARQEAPHRLRLGVDVGQDLGHAVVHLAGDAHPLLGDRQRAQLLVQMGVVDGDRGGGGEPLQGLLVLLAELGRRLLLGQVEIAAKRPLADDRHRQQRIHRWVVGRHAGRAGVVVDAWQPQAPALVQHHPQQPAALRR